MTSPIESNFSMQYIEYFRLQFPQIVLINVHIPQYLVKVYASLKIKSIDLICLYFEYFSWNFLSFITLVQNIFD